MSEPVEVLQSLRSTLVDLQARGEERIWITPEARNLLANLPQRLNATPSSAPPAAVAAQAPESPLPKFETSLAPEGDTPAEKIASLTALAADWQPARDLGSLRETMVFSVGNPGADLMFVGEAPGIDEEKQREPFVGKAGQLLTKMIGAMGLERPNVYISNICKFRPAMPDQGTGNRKPTPEEMKACLPFVLSEIEVVRPRAIVALGGTAAEGLLGIQAPVGRMRSQFHDLQGVPVMVTYHPSYLLRNQALGERRKVWEDMLLVMEKLGLPISDKQRGYFT